MFTQVVIPGIKMDELTYSIPRGMVLHIGDVVEVGVRREVKRGVVVGIKRKSSISYTRSVLKKIDSRIPITFLKLSRWVKERYLSFWGESLKLIFSEIPEDKVKEIVKDEKKDFHLASDIEKFLNKSERMPISIRGALSVEEVINIIRRFGRGIIIVPYIEYVNDLYLYIKGKGINVERWHSEMGRESRRVWYKIFRGEVDIVVGTRSAIFLPMFFPSFILLMDEANSAYREVHRPPYYNTVPVALKRQEIEGGELFLVDELPSIYRYYSVEKLKMDRIVRKISWKGNLMIIDMKERESFISPELERILREDERILVIHPYAGYASRIVCKDCGYVLKCPDCDYPLSMEKKFTPYCRICNKYYEIERCPFCKGTFMTIRRIGTERLKDILKKYREDVEEFSGSFSKRDINEIMKLKNGRGVIIGTESLIKFSKMVEPDSIIFTNLDRIVYFHDYNGYFKSFYLVKEAMKYASKVLVQTWSGDSKFYMYLREMNIEEFMKWEMKRRESLNYPPFSIMVVITVIAFREETARIIADRIYSMIKDSGLSPHGPVESPYKKYRGEKRMIIMVKCNFKSLNKLRNLLLLSYSRVKIRIEVDPDEVE